MKRRKWFIVFYASIIAILATTMAINASLAIYGKNANSNGSYGTIDLRSYFQRGDGRTPETAYVITRPRHMYNLSRLQGLGVFSEKVYFQLGDPLLDTSVDDPALKQPLCYVGETSVTKPYLDMSQTYSNYNLNPINAIGSESKPFYGVFDGQNVEIKNLSVFADPQDAGLFGYTAHGSAVKNLFLDNITINTLGYTDNYADLYGAYPTNLERSAKFIYEPNDGGANTIFDYQSDASLSAYFFAYDNFEIDVNESYFDKNNAQNSKAPSITYEIDNNNYRYKTLISGDLIKDDGGVIAPDLERLFTFFAEERNKAEAPFPMQASSSVSLVASKVDSYGQEYSKVLLSLDFVFTLDSYQSNMITMNVSRGVDHGNNIGLVVGHCDGSVYDCYVHNGSFVMNDGGNITGESYNSLSNGSNLGLIGLIGGTVHNVLAEQSDNDASEGKDVGVIDFTTIYKDIITSSSFTNSVEYGSGWTYSPRTLSKYIDYLRYNVDTNYVTFQKDSVSFKGQEVISNTDLGVFTIVTDPSSTGLGTDVLLNISNSAIKKESLEIGDDASYYLYYATGEYSADSGLAFADYSSSFNSNNPTQLFLGHHLPEKGNYSSKTGIEYRERHQNYFVRFKLDPNNRLGRGFYFSDVNRDSAGGSFLSDYFTYKLVDQNSQPIPAAHPRCGVMLKDSLGHEIKSFSASFMTQDLSNNITYCTKKDDLIYAGNMINFEIKSDLANVTVVASPANLGGNAAVGVYRIDGETGDNADCGYINGKLVFNQPYNEPDYAFFMPDDNHLAYFDYSVDDQKVGQIGTYNPSTNVFEIADESTNATMPKTSGYYGAGKSEYGFESGKLRLYTHTFKLEKGRYCIGSATSGSNIAKIYYVCAQGQNDGQFEIANNIFSGNDSVENVDFLKLNRFASDGNEIIDLDSVVSYDPLDMSLANQRCYVCLVNSDRSIFGSGQGDLIFQYDSANGKFIIDSNHLNMMSHVAVNNYNHNLSGDTKELLISLFGNESYENVVSYSYSG